MTTNKRKKEMILEEVFSILDRYEPLNTNGFVTIKELFNQVLGMLIVEGYSLREIHYAVEVENETIRKYYAIAKGVEELDARIEAKKKEHLYSSYF